MENKVYFGENIRTLRKLSGITQQKLAEELGVGRPRVGAWEEGRAEPPLTIVLAIAKHFGVTPSELIGKNLKVELVIGV